VAANPVVKTIDDEARGMKATAANITRTREITSNFLRRRRVLLRSL